MTSSDDASHDEALTSRIAALNMLDLNMGHLDVDVGEAGADVDVIVRACGESEYQNFVYFSSIQSQSQLSKLILNYNSPYAT
jgi:hypothetical protein